MPMTKHDGNHHQENTGWTLVTKHKSLGDTTMGEVGKKLEETNRDGQQKNKFNKQKSALCKSVRQSGYKSTNDFFPRRYGLEISL